MQQGISICLFGIIDYVEIPQLFTLLSFICRFMQGMGNGAINASCNDPFNHIIILLLANAIVQGEFPDKVGSLISLQQAFTNLGMLSGPIMGSYLFLWGGFKCPFFVLGLTLITLTLVTQLSVKKDLSIKDRDGDEETYKLIADANKRSGFFYLLKHFVNQSLI